MTVRTALKREASAFTTSERKVANLILADYPFAGLQPIQQLADRAGVSAPSITRFVGKLGFAGFQEFQRHLIGELKEGRSSPVDLMLAGTPSAPAEFLADYANRATIMLRQMAENISDKHFAAVCGLLADPARSIFLLGGRISDSVATFLSMHLRQMRAKVYHMSSNPEVWPEHILRMRKQDVVILFDFRRYQTDLLKLARIIHEKRQPTTVLVTDQWTSPIARHSDYVFGLPTEIGTAWDTTLSAIALVEAMIVKVSESDWAATKKRIEAWDSVRLYPPDDSDKDEKDAE